MIDELSIWHDQSSSTINFPITNVDGHIFYGLFLCRFISTEKIYACIHMCPPEMWLYILIFYLPSFNQNQIIKCPSRDSLLYLTRVINFIEMVGSSSLQSFMLVPFF